MKVFGKESPVKPMHLTTGWLEKPYYGIRFVPDYTTMEGWVLTEIVVNCAILPGPRAWATVPLKKPTLLQRLKNALP